MEISYKTNKIKSLCTDVAKAKKEFNNDKNSVDRFFKMLAILRNSPSLIDVSCAPPPRRHKLSGDYKGCFAVDINKIKGTRIVFQPIEDNDDLAKIEAINIVYIGDYHN